MIFKMVIDLDEEAMITIEGHPDSKPIHMPHENYRNIQCNGDHGFSGAIASIDCTHIHFIPVRCMESLTC